MLCLGGLNPPPSQGVGGLKKSVCQCCVCRGWGAVGRLGEMNYAGLLRLEGPRDRVWARSSSFVNLDERTAGR